MAVTYQIYNEDTNTRRSVTVDFLGNILAASGSAFNSEYTYYFRVRTTARTEDNGNIPEILALSLDDLVLNGISQRRTNTSDPYTNINDMVEDYLYDFVNGHDADLYGTGVTYRAPMQF